jgi:hypothetical protein
VHIIQRNEAAGLRITVRILVVFMVILFVSMILPRAQWPQSLCDLVYQEVAGWLLVMQANAHPFMNGLSRDFNERNR